MNDIYEEIVDRIRGQVTDLEQLVQRVLMAWSHSKRSQDDEGISLDSVALNLHGFYSGLERLFELISRHVDQSVPAGEIWHRDLLQQMCQEIPNVRPAVISSGTISSLDELRRFRHLVRNVYTFNLVPGKMESLVLDLPELWSKVKAELLAFADFLSELAGETKTIK
ncbi:MAG: antitoxin [Deltaproteobacteria bacterium]|nr:antitoxin [Deltaproteobacteria bacterium]